MSSQARWIVFLSPSAQVYIYSKDYKGAREFGNVR